MQPEFGVSSKNKKEGSPQNQEPTKNHTQETEKKDNIPMAGRPEKILCRRGSTSKGSLNDRR